MSPRRHDDDLWCWALDRQAHEAALADALVTVACDRCCGEGVLDEGDPYRERCCPVCLGTGLVPATCEAPTADAPCPTDDDAFCVETTVTTVTTVTTARAA